MFDPLTVSQGGGNVYLLIVCRRSDTLILHFIRVLIFTIAGQYSHQNCPKRGPGQKSAVLPK